jgi:putative tryptophan/tyrosine transport system substrate-binding protein
MRRRLAGCIAAVALLAAPTLALAQLAPTAPRIGWLSLGNAPPDPNRGVPDFQQGLRDVGYVVGKNIAIEYRFANGNSERLPELAAELVRLPVDVIVTSGEPAALAAKRATTTVPVVATEFGLDPVKAGLVASLGRPGGNITGMATISEELWEKRLGLLRQIAPKVARLAVLWNPANPGNAVCLSEIESAAKPMGVRLQPLEVGDGKALERAFATIVKEPADSIVTCWDSVTLENARAIGDFGLKRRLPTLAPLKEYVQAGALMSYGASLPALRRRAAYYVDKILKGTKPANLPVERPTVFELVVNLSTAKALGLTVPPALMFVADDVIE